MRSPGSVQELHHRECAVYANETEEDAASKSQDVSLSGRGKWGELADSVGRDDRIKALVEKLTTLENVVRTTGVGTPSASSAPPSATAKPYSVSSTGGDISPRPTKRSRNDEGSIETVTSTQDLLSPPDSVTSQLHRNGGARDHIEKELTLNESLKSHQRSVFETAIAFIDQLSQGPTTSVEEEAWNLNVSTDFSKGELVQIVLTSNYIPLPYLYAIP